MAVTWPSIRTASGTVRPQTRDISVIRDARRTYAKSSQQLVECDASALVGIEDAEHALELVHVDVVQSELNESIVELLSHAQQTYIACRPYKYVMSV